MSPIIVSHAFGFCRRPAASSRILQSIGFRLPLGRGFAMTWNNGRALRRFRSKKRRTACRFDLDFL
jgi:hypothetical protein